MVDSQQQHELGAPPAVEELVPELADADLMASCDLRETCRKGVDALVRLYDKRYKTRREDFLNQRKKGKPLSKNEVSRFHRQWREYVRGVVEPLFVRARRTARLQAFVREQEQKLGCKLMGSTEAQKIVPFLNLKLLAQKGRLRQVQFDKQERYHSEEDLKRIAVEDADIIEKKRKKNEADQRRKAREYEERTMKNRLSFMLCDYDIARDVRDRLVEEAASFRSVRDLFETDHFTTSWDLALPKDCIDYLEKELRAIGDAEASSRASGR